MSPPTRRAGLAAALPAPIEALGTAPGRINTIGGHTDYTEGLALAAAIDRSCTVALCRRPEPLLSLHALDLPAHATLELGQERPPADCPPWARAMWGAVEVHARHHGPVGGLHAAITSDVPRGAGMSSSAAVLVAWMAALAALQGIHHEAHALAALAQEVEHRWMGVPCGLLDQLASAAGRAGSLLAIDFRPPISVVPVDDVLPGTVWMVLDTGVRRALAESGYAERVAQVQAGLAETGQSHWRGLQQAHLAAVHDPVLRARLRHGITENDRVRRAIRAARAGDAPAFGALLRESHRSLRDDHAVSSPELDHLVRTACAIDGVHGARMMGGGFGGCVLALVDAAAAPAVEAALASVAAGVHTVRPAGGAQGWRADAPPSGGPPDQLG